MKPGRCVCIGYFCRSIQYHGRYLIVPGTIRLSSFSLHLLILKANLTFWWVEDGNAKDICKKENHNISYFI